MHAPAGPCTAAVRLASRSRVPKHMHAIAAAGSSSSFPEGALCKMPRVGLAFQIIGIRAVPIQTPLVESKSQRLHHKKLYLQCKVCYFSLYGPLVSLTFILDLREDLES